MDRRSSSSARPARPRDVWRRRPAGRANIDRDELIEQLKADAQAAYDRREAEVGEEVMRELERRVVLSVLDRKWREHLYEMDYLREGIYLRAYSQRDPLVEYQREGFEMFAAMMDGIKEESVGFLFNLEVQVEEDDEDEDDEPMVARRSPRSTSSRCGEEQSRRRRPSRSRATRGAADPGQGARAAASSRRTCRTPRPPRTARSRSRPRHGDARRRRVRRGRAATRCARAARARSTSGATARRAAPPG